MGFLWWLIIGLIAGGVARLLIPGKQPMGLLMTMILGLVGVGRWRTDLDSDLRL
jgi:uncharacterized membrane protein YeaQ/YmgE (transglycosylase-associated protein family)